MSLETIFIAASGFVIGTAFGAFALSLFGARKQEPDEHESASI